MSRESSKRKLENTHEAEIKERWGGTPVYEEYKVKTKDYAPGKWAASNLFMMVVFEEFSECMKAGRTSGSEEAHHCLSQRERTSSYIHGDAQSRDHQEGRRVRYRGRLSVASRRPP